MFSGIPKEYIPENHSVHQERSLQECGGNAWRIVIVKMCPSVAVKTQVQRNHGQGDHACYPLHTTI